MSFAEDLIRQIEADGGWTVHDYMARCNAHYYAARDPLGSEGDFTTAPEISQMFGELIGAWAADLWQRAGAPDAFRLVELGPGRGTLMADLLRAAGSLPGFREAARVVMVENSPVLQARQKQAVPAALHVTELSDIPDGLPSIIIANEFFDALPVEQTMRTSGGKAPRRIVADNGALRFDDEGGEIEETPAAGLACLDLLAERMSAGGALLMIDYGYTGGERGDTLQAVRRHEKVDPLAFPGESDLTAHVDFAAFAKAGREAGLSVFGPTMQAAFLSALGLGMRAEMLMKSSNEPGQAEIAAAVHRLTAPDQMGALFKAIAFAHSDWPAPAGFPQ